MDLVRRSILGDADVPVDGSGVRVAILDTGIDPDHPDLAHAVDIVERTCLALDDFDRHGHGTHVAGIIGGSGALSSGKFRGLAPGVRLACFKVSPQTLALGADVAIAVEKALEWGADIINYSGGQAGPPDPPWKWSTKLGSRDRAFRKAAERGVFCVAAAGNQGPHEASINRPAALPEVVAVGALGGPEEIVAEPSSRGPVYVDPALGRGEVVRFDSKLDDAVRLEQRNTVKPDLVAPGGQPRELPAASYLAPRVPRVGPVSCLSGKSDRYLPLDTGKPKFLYTRLWGTSQATAVISGLAALVLEYGRSCKLDWGPQPGQAVGRVLRAAATLPDPRGSDTDYGVGKPTWSRAREVVEECLKNPARWSSLIGGQGLQLI